MEVKEALGLVAVQQCAGPLALRSLLRAGGIIEPQFARGSEIEAQHRGRLVRERKRASLGQLVSQVRTDPGHESRAQRNDSLATVLRRSRLNRHGGLFRSQIETAAFEAANLRRAQTRLSGEQVDQRPLRAGNFDATYLPRLPALGCRDQAREFIDGCCTSIMPTIIAHGRGVLLKVNDRRFSSATVENHPPAELLERLEIEIACLRGKALVAPALEIRFDTIAGDLAPIGELAGIGNLPGTRCHLLRLLARPAFVNDRRLEIIKMLAQWSRCCCCIFIEQAPLTKFLAQRRLKSFDPPHEISIGARPRGHTRIEPFKMPPKFQAVLSISKGAHAMPHTPMISKRDIPAARFARLAVGAGEFDLVQFHLQHSFLQAKYNSSAKPMAARQAWPLDSA